LLPDERGVYIRALLDPTHAHVGGMREVEPLPIDVPRPGIPVRRVAPEIAAA